MPSKKIKALLIVLIFALALVLSFFYFLNKKETLQGNEILGKQINIGVVTYLGEGSNDWTMSGKGALLGAQAYLKKFNATGGIYNRKINLIVKDVLLNDEKKTNEAVAEVLNDQKVMALMFPYCTQQTASVHRALQGKGVPLLFPLSSVVLKGNDVYNIRPSFFDEYRSNLKKFSLSIPVGVKSALITERHEICFKTRSLFLEGTKNIENKLASDFFYNPNFHKPLKLINDPKYKELFNNLKKIQKDNIEVIYLFSTETGAYILNFIEKIKL